MRLIRELLKPHHEEILSVPLLCAMTTIYAVMLLQRWSREAAAGSVGFLKKMGWLYSFPLFPGVDAFRWTAAACHAFGESSCHARRLGEQAPVARCAILHDGARRRALPFAPQLLADKWPELLDFADFNGRILPGEHCPVVIAHVDHGADPRRVPAKVRKLLGRFARHPEAGRLVRKELLGVRILVPTEAKAEAVERELLRSVGLPGLTEIAVAEEIAHILF